MSLDSNGERDDVVDLVAAGERIEHCAGRIARFLRGCIELEDSSQSRPDEKQRRWMYSSVELDLVHAKE
jgi:hypothetical protein